VLAADGPALLEVVTDPEVPPLPPHIRFEQAEGLAKALIKGERSRRAIIAESLKGKLAELTTR
jgi:pyruvate dehydrogenase (quinone)